MTVATALAVADGVALGAGGTATVAAAVPVVVPVAVATVVGGTVAVAAGVVDAPPWLFAVVAVAPNAGAGEAMVVAVNGAVALDVGAEDIDAVAAGVEVVAVGVAVLPPSDAAATGSGGGRKTATGTAAINEAITARACTTRTASFTSPGGIPRRRRPIPP